MKLPAQASRALRDSYLELYVLSGLLREGRVSLAQGKTARARAEQLIAAGRQQQLSAGVPEVWTSAARLAIVALIDESARRSRTPDFGVRWDSLQFPLYGHENLGVQFFEQLKTLRENRDTPTEVLEIYSRCLALDFQGQFDPDGLESLRIIQEGLKYDLAKALESPPPLSPHLVEGTVGAALVPMLGLRWMAAIAIGLILLLGVGLTFSLMSAAGKVAGELYELRGGAGSGSSAARGEH